MSASPSVTLLQICHNDSATLVETVTSLLNQENVDAEVEIIIVDIASSDNSVATARAQFPQVTVLESQQVNYSAAVNLGIKSASSDYIALVDCSVKLNPEWLSTALSAFESHKDIGLAQGALLTADGASAAQDIWHPDQSAECADNSPMLFLRRCIEEVGSWDEQLLYSLEHIDFVMRCQKKGFARHVASNAIAQQVGESSIDQATTRYLSARNRLYLTAKHRPDLMLQSIEDSPFYLEGEYDNLYRALLFAIRAYCIRQNEKESRTMLRQIAAKLPDILGAVSSHNFFSQLQLQLGLRRIRVGIYDHAGHFTGGGQRYMADLAALIQDRYDVTYIFNKDVSLDKYADWYDLDLSRCKAKIIPIPFYEERNWYTPDEAMVTTLKENAFDVVSAETINYDIFINTNMLGKVNPLALQSVFICHFPDRHPDHFFQVPKYDHLVVSGEYSRGWVRKRWNLEPTFKLYPPVSMYGENSSPENKEKIILSVSRFEVTRSKKQLEMVKAFTAMCMAQPEETDGWKLILAGGSTPENKYLDLVRSEAASSDCNIEIKANAPLAEIRDLYRRARIFWHACGLNEKRPERVEHFGMTTVEAMQNYCVPIVIDGGGQREIVEDGKSGFRFSTLEELSDHSLRVMCDDRLSRETAIAAYERSKLYNHDIFREALEELLADIEHALIGQETL